MSIDSSIRKYTKDIAAKKKNNEGSEKKVKLWKKKKHVNMKNKETRFYMVGYMVGIGSDFRRSIFFEGGFWLIDSLFRFLENDEGRKGMISLPGDEEKFDRKSSRRRISNQG